MFRKIKKFFELRKQRRLMNKRKKRNNNKNQVMGSTFVIDNRDNFNSDMLDTELIDKNTIEFDKKKVRQFTKIIVMTLMISAICWITFSYVLAAYAVCTFQDTETLEELSKQVCSTLLGVVISYAIKAFLESFSQKTINPYLHIDKDGDGILNEEGDFDVGESEAVG